MDWPIRVQGRWLYDTDVEHIRRLLRVHPEWNRSRLSRELCAQWGWQRADGQMKDMACRELLLKLERRSLVSLPPRQRQQPRLLPPERPVVDETPLRCPLTSLRPLTVVDARKQRDDERLFNALMAHYHYLGFSRPVGQNMKYLVRAANGRVVACLLFGSAAWSCACRDNFIGWDQPTREERLQSVTNNTRFLILPFVTVKCLASYVLAQVLRRLRNDWQDRYGSELALVETFVDTERFRGTCYQAANFRYLGTTRGRSRQDRRHRLRVSPKDVYVYALRADFRRRLGAEQ